LEQLCPTSPSHLEHKKGERILSIYPLEVRGFSAIAEKNPRNRGEKSPQSRRKIPAIAEKNPRDRGEKSPRSRRKIPAILS
jgi:hypothetical protein